MSLYAPFIDNNKGADNNEDDKQKEGTQKFSRADLRYSEMLNTAQANLVAGQSFEPTSTYGVDWYFFFHLCFPTCFFCPCESHLF